MTGPRVLEPPAGTVAVNAWQDPDGSRHILLVAALRPMSFVQRPFHGKGLGHESGAGRRYNAWRQATREQLLVACRTAEVKPLTEGMLCVAFGGGMTRQGRSPSVLGHDVDDLQKAASDVCTGLLYISDRQIRAFTASAWYDFEADWFSVAVWGPDAAGDLDARRQGGSATMGHTRGDWLRATEEVKNA